MKHGKTHSSSAAPLLHDYTVRDSEGLYRATVQAPSMAVALERIGVIAMCLQTGISMPVDVREHWGETIAPYFSDFWFHSYLPDECVALYNRRALRQYAFYNEDNVIQVVVEAPDMDTAIARIPEITKQKQLPPEVRVREYVGTVSVTWLRDGFFRQSN